MKTLKYFCYTLCIVFSSLLCGCNQEDDINEIFDSGVWQLVNYYTGGDWNSNNDRYARPAYTEAQDLETLGKITITFDSDGTFNGTLDGGTFEGNGRPTRRTEVLPSSAKSRLPSVCLERMLNSSRN